MIQGTRLLFSYLGSKREMQVKVFATRYFYLPILFGWEPQTLQEIDQSAAYEVIRGWPVTIHSIKIKKLTLETFNSLQKQFRSGTLMFKSAKV